MKRYLILLFSGLILFTSCEDKFLERYPLDEIFPEVYFNTDNDLKLFANRFYTLLPAHANNEWRGGTFFVEENSDNMAPVAFDIRLSGTRTIPSSDKNWDWSEIRQANYFLEKCNKAKGDPASILMYIGEVKFFKALLYFEKVKNFGDVPWLYKTLNTDSPELFNPRDSRKVVVDSIIACLDYSIANLKPKSSTEPFRINKEAALLLKARICLYEGTWEKYHQNTPFGVAGQNGAQFLQLAADAVNQLMAMGTLSLYKGGPGWEYWDLFNKVDYSTNQEILLWKKFDVGLGIVHNISAVLSGSGNKTGISKSLIDSYLCTDGKPISVSPDFMGYNSLEGQALNRDPRLKQTIFLKGYFQVTNVPAGQGEVKFGMPPLDKADQFRSTTGYCLYKGVNPDYNQQISSGGNIGSIIMRYTEALLIYAEAKAELGTITQADIDKTVNLIRDRVGLTHLDLANITPDPNWDYPALSPIINEVRRERRVELAFENTRWEDISRWRAHHLIVGKRPLGIKYVGSNLEGKYINSMGQQSIFVGQNLFVDANGFVDPYQTSLPNGYGFNPVRDYLAPIPSDEITLNKNLVQNPGW